MTPIYRGENKVLTRTLRQADGSALLVSSLSLAKVELIQDGTVLYTYTKGTNNELRGSSDYLTLELTSAVTAALAPGVLRERYTLNFTDVNVLVDGGVAKHIIELDQIVIV